MLHRAAEAPRILAPGVQAEAIGHMSYRRAAFACLALGVLAGSCSMPASEPSANEAVVYVIGRGWHTDIGLPVEEIAGPLAALKADFPGVRYLTFGFGERQFLVTRSTDFGAMLRALLPSQSALLVTALAATPEAAFGRANVVVLGVSRAGLERIEDGIWRQLVSPPGDDPVRLAEGPYDGSVFYASQGSYNALFTCNTWTAQTLRAGGLAIPASGVLFASQVMGMAHWIGAQQDPSPGY